MRCQECGESARDVSLRYCENCGAKMPVAPDRRTSARPALKDGGVPAGEVSSRTVTRDASEPPRASPLPPEPERPSGPAYDGPAVLAHVPGHSPSVLAVGLQWLAVLLPIIPLFSSVGALGSLIVLFGGWFVVARELRDAGMKHGLFDWVPEPLMHPAVPAVYALASVALAVRMLGLGITPLLWLVAAGVLVYDQYRKIYVGEAGWSRYFEPRQLLHGTALVTLAGVGVCLVALYFNWVPARIISHTGGPVPRGPSQLQVVDAPSSSSDFLYNLLNAPEDAGWDRPGAVALELVLFALLALLALRPEVPRPAWLRFAPLGAVVLALVWMLVFGGVMAGPLVFLIGLALVGIGSVVQAFVPQEAEEPPHDESFPGSYEDPPEEPAPDDSEEAG